MNFLVCCLSEIESNELGNRQRVVVRGSLRENLPPSLNVKSANLRVLHPIGQGTSMTTTYDNVIVIDFNHYQENLA